MIVREQRKHHRPPCPRHRDPKYRKSPWTLRVHNVAVFLAPRNISEMGGINVYFRLTVSFNLLTLE